MAATEAEGTKRLAEGGTLVADAGGALGMFLPRDKATGRTGLEEPAQDILHGSVHGGIKGINALIELGRDAMDKLESLGIMDAESHWDVADEAYDHDYYPLVRKPGPSPYGQARIPNLPDPETPAGKLASGISQFLVGFKGVDKALKGIKAASRGASVAKTAGTSFAADFAFFDGQEERLSNVIQANPELANPVNEFLAAKPGEGNAEGRLKNAMEGLGVGMLAEGLVHGLRLTKVGREVTNGEMRTAEEGTLRNSVTEEASVDATATAARAAAFKERQPAVTLTGKEFAEKEPKLLRQEVRSWYKQNLAGASGQHPKLGEFRFSSDIGKPLSKSADIRKLQIFPKLREVIETSEYVAKSPSIKSKHLSSSSMDYYYVRNTAKIGDELVDVGLVLRKDNNGQLYYDHQLHDMKAIENAPWASPAAINPLSPKGTANGPKGTRGSHPALHGASQSNLLPGGGEVNLFILGVRSLRGFSREREQNSPPAQ